MSYQLTLPLRNSQKKKSTRILDDPRLLKVAELLKSVFGFVLPSLPFFFMVSVLLKKGYNFDFSFGAATAVMMSLYFVLVIVLRMYGIQLQRWKKQTISTIHMEPINVFAATL